eukprot:m.116558 g.116558  ORF g.116558 m.116558 type:complete len:147 (+) comp37581_c0_seq7:406-846(+)
MIRCRSLLVDPNTRMVLKLACHLTRVSITNLVVLMTEVLLEKRPVEETEDKKQLLAEMAELESRMQKTKQLKEQLQGRLDVWDKQKEGEREKNAQDVAELRKQNDELQRESSQQKKLLAEKARSCKRSFLRMLSNNCPRILKFEVP